MKNIIQMLATFVLGLSLAFETRSRGLVAAANTYDAAVATNGETLRRTADAALTTRHLLVKKGAGALTVAINGAADLPLGVVDNITTAADEAVTVARLASGEKTRKVVASGIIAVNAFVYTDADGKVQAEPAVAGSYYLVGRALTAAAADTNVIEIEPIAPVKIVVIAALTSSNGTAAGAADLTALKAEAEKIGDDVRAIAAALAAPALIKVLAAG